MKEIWVATAAIEPDEIVRVEIPDDFWSRMGRVSLGIGSPDDSAIVGNRRTQVVEQVMGALFELAAKDQS